MDTSDDDMTRPITRGELKEEMADFERRIDAKLDAKLDLFLGALMARLDGRFESIDARFEVIDRRFEAIDRRFEAIDARFDKIERRFDAFRLEVDDRFVQLRADVDRDIARHTSAMTENLRTFIVALDDKYKDRPPRVARLEAAVFPSVPPPRTVRAAPKKRRRKAS